LSAKSSRLLTLLGLPGIGKSSLVRKTIQHISERMLLPGGYIIINVRGIKDCEVFLRTFNQQVITEENPMFYFTLGQALEQGRSMQQDSLTITDLILEKIASLEQKVLLVIDNAEDLITFDKTTHKNSFKQLVQYFLNQVPNLKILLTTRQRLKLQSDFNEEVILLYGLPALQSEILFAKLSR
jgi:Cdc6-like AAA superfamily ATPase